MDLSRLLVRDVADLEKSDMADSAIAAFRQNRVREVVILARRGPAQAAFAAKELEDIVDLPNVRVVVDAAHVAQDLANGSELDGLVKRKLEYLRTLAEREAAASPPAEKDKRVVFRFLTSPVEIVGDGGRVTGIRVEKNALVTDAKGRTAARGTGVFETIPVGLVFRSVGYRGVPIPGVPFDEAAGIVPNVEGRVQRDGAPWPGVYVAGWIKRGPSGVIGTNKSDAADTVRKMIEDIAALRAEGGSPDKSRPREGILALLSERGVVPVTWTDWKKLDRLERERGAAVGKVRDKFTETDAMLSALSGLV
jgi:ferredoxin--NADP+ reductase